MPLRFKRPGTQHVVEYIFTKSRCSSKLPYLNKSITNPSKSPAVFNAVARKPFAIHALQTTESFENFSHMRSGQACSTQECRIQHHNDKCHRNVRGILEVQVHFHWCFATNRFPVNIMQTIDGCKLCKNLFRPFVSFLPRVFS